MVFGDPHRIESEFLRQQQVFGFLADELRVGSAAAPLVGEAGGQAYVHLALLLPRWSAPAGALAALSRLRCPTSRMAAIRLSPTRRASPRGRAKTWEGCRSTLRKRAAMRIEHIPVGDNPPESLNVIIEVPTGGEPVKYEFDKQSGALFVDRILHTPMRYPANYGFVPHTLSPDGDPLDALVIARSPFIPG